MVDYGEQLDDYTELISEKFYRGKISEVRYAQLVDKLDEWETQARRVMYEAIEMFGGEA